MLLRLNPVQRPEAHCLPDQGHCSTRTFYATCATQLTFVDDATPAETDITIGSLDDPNGLAPQDHTFTSEKLAWLILGDGLPEYRRRRSDG